MEILKQKEEEAYLRNGISPDISLVNDESSLSPVAGLQDCYLPNDKG